jgi:hypothetical protein
MFARLAPRGENSILPLDDGGRDGYQFGPSVVISMTGLLE